MLIDLTPLQPHGAAARHGASDYARIICRQLARNARSGDLRFIYDKTLPLEPAVAAELSSRRHTLDSVSGRKEFIALVRQSNNRIFYSPLYQDWYTDLAKNNLRTIITIHGCRQFEMPTDQYERYFIRGLRPSLRRACISAFPKIYEASRLQRFTQCIRSASLLIASSEHTKRIINALCPSTLEQVINVFYCPDQVPPLDSLPIATPLGLKAKDFFLLVSAGVWIKNAYRAAAVLDDLYTHVPSEMPSKTVLLGVSDRSPFRRLRNRDRFVFNGYVEADDLYSLYRDAACLFYPSLSEGFGYPPIAAMHYGTPVIASSFGAVPEICGDGVLYCNPLSLLDMKSQVLRLIRDSQTRQTLIRNGISRSAYVRTLQINALASLTQLLLTFSR